jgi:hypothetical protein
MSKHASFISNLPAFAGGGLAIGAGARLIKNLADLARRNTDEGQVASMEPSVAPLAEIPVKITPEEAEALKRKGIKVRKMLRKNAFVFDNIGLGAAAVGGAVGGWSLLDKLIHKNRKATLRGDVSTLRKRIEKVLDDEPEEQDQKLHAYMKAAEDLYFKKVGFLDTGLQVLGGGAALAAMAAYKAQQRNNRYIAAIKAIKGQARSRPSEAARAVLVPILEEESAGSPSQQATTHGL